jgi:hypothetical protein
MCELYKFEAEQFGVSDDSIHLLRNRFNYQTINFKEIDSVTIKTGKDLKNWVIVLLYIVFICFSLEVRQLEFILKDCLSPFSP